MTRDYIIKLAREAGAVHIHERPKELALVGNEAIERFFQATYAAGAAAEQAKFSADLIEYGKAMAAVEREACAKVCETNGIVHPIAAQRIRERGTHET